MSKRAEDKCPDCGKQMIATWADQKEGMLQPYRGWSCANETDKADGCGYLIHTVRDLNLHAALVEKQLWPCGRPEGY